MNFAHPIAASVIEREIHATSIKELEDGLAPELIAELERISLPFSEQTPTDAELRIAQAQLVGWLEGLFHGIQTAIYAQQISAQNALQQMRQSLPAGTGETKPETEPGKTGPEHTNGMYL